MNGLLHNAEIDRVLTRNAGTSGGTVSSDIVDMKGFDWITWVIAFQDVLTTSVITVSMLEDDDSAMGSTTEVAAADKITRTAGASDVDSKLMVYECLRPKERYVRLTVGIATANAPIDSIVAIKGKARTVKVTQPADVLDQKQVATPTTS